MKHLLIFFLALQLIACGGGVDNAEPPAELIDFTASAKLSVIKEIEYSASVSRFARVKPLQLDDVIVFSEVNGEVTVFSKQSMDIIWQKKLENISPTAIGGNNKVYLLGTRSGEVIALAAKTGDQLWRVRVSSEVLARPVTVEGVVVVKTVDGQITGLDLSNGNEKWIYKKDVPALSVRGNSTPLVIDQKIITGLDNGKLVILDLFSGVLIWEKTVTIPRGRSETERLVDLDADIIIDKNIIYIAGFQGRVVALDLATGEFLWIKKMSVIRNMTLDDGQLYITDVLSHIWAVDVMTGATVWKQGAFTARKLTTASVMDDYLLLGDYQGYLHVLAKADGHLVARHQVEESGIDISPLIFDNKIYIQNRNSKIFILQLKP